MNELEELFYNLCYIFNNEKLVSKASREDVFEMDYVKVFVLLLSYFKICTVPKYILEDCLSGSVIETQYEELYEFCSNKWEEKANQEIDDLIFKIESGFEEL